MELSNLFFVVDAVIIAQNYFPEVEDASISGFVHLDNLVDVDFLHHTQAVSESTSATSTGRDNQLDFLQQADRTHRNLVQEQ